MVTQDSRRNTTLSLFLRPPTDLGDYPPPPLSGRRTPEPPKEKIPTIIKIGHSIVQKPRGSLRPVFRPSQVPPAHKFPPIRTRTSKPRSRARARERTAPDRSFTMLHGKTTRELVLARLVIFLSGHIGLLCLIYFVVALQFRAVTAPFSVFIEVIGILEILWYLFWYLPYKLHLQKRPGYIPPPLMKGQRNALFNAGLEYVPDVEQFIRKWMNNAHMEDIRRENLKEWLMWALFESDGPPGDANVELEDYITEMEDKLEARIRPGRGESEPVRPNFDSVRMAHRSLAYYMVIGLIDTITTIILFTMGFSFYRQPRASFLRTFPFRPMTLISMDESASPRLSYFYRPHSSTTQRPIFFVHGIGVGLFPYLKWLRTLPPDVGILAVELLPISNRITAPMPSTPELVDAFAAVLAQQSPHYDREFVFIGDSFGTFAAAPLLTQTDLAPRVSRVILVNPVAMLLHLPDVTYNLTGRRKPRTAGEWMLWYVGGMDPGAAHTLARRFSWREMILWRETLQDEQVARRTTVVLGSEDRVVNAHAVASYSYFGDTHFNLTDVEEWKTTGDRWSGAGDIELLWLEGLDHGEVFARRDACKRLNKVVETYCVRGTSLSKTEDDFYAMGYAEANPGQAPEVVPRGTETV